MLCIASPDVNPPFFSITSTTVAATGRMLSLRRSIQKCSLFTIESVDRAAINSLTGKEQTDIEIAIEQTGEDFSRLLYISQADHDPVTVEE
jgi:hypothetical protein